MDRRVHEVLDGEREREELTPRERAELVRYERAIDRPLGALAEEPVPDVAPAVMARIAASHAPSVAGEAEVDPPPRSAHGAGGWRGALARGAGWLWRPRPIEVSLRPAWGLAFGLAAALWIAGRPWSGDAPLAGPGTAAAPEAGQTPLEAPASATVLVQFRLEAPGARAVRLAGDFTAWEPVHVLYEQAPGVWSVVVPLAPGVHDYVFVVDDEEWRTDPLAPQVADGFGGLNSRMAVLLPEPGERS